VRAAEGGKEVVERHFVGDIDGRDAGAPFVAIPVEKIIVAQSQIKQAARRDARRIVIVVLRAGRGNFDERRSVK
jgi:hypothetical protein